MDENLQLGPSPSLPPMVRLDPPDGWDVLPFGDWELDVTLGRFYAESVVRYARAIKQPGFVIFVLASISNKIAFGALTPGGVEHGFHQRVAELAYCGSMN